MFNDYGILLILDNLTFYCGRFSTLAQRLSFEFYKLILTSSRLSQLLELFRELQRSLNEASWRWLMTLSIFCGKGNWLVVGVFAPLVANDSWQISSYLVCCLNLSAVVYVNGLRYLYAFGSGSGSGTCRGSGSGTGSGTEKQF